MFMVTGCIIPTGHDNNNYKQEVGGYSYNSFQNIDRMGYYFNQDGNSVQKTINRLQFQTFYSQRYPEPNQNPFQNTEYRNNMIGPEGLTNLIILMDHRFAQKVF